MKELDFTRKAEDALYEAIDSTAYLYDDANIIYGTLLNRMEPLPFGDYLKRYVCTKAGLSPEDDDKTYSQIIRSSFAENGVPASFEPSTVKLSQLVNNWLTQKTVNRKVVFLLAFGLNMDETDLEEFLQKALHEPGINFKDPFETLCWYCRKNKIKYAQFAQLWQQFQEGKSGNGGVAFYAEKTSYIRQELYSVKNEYELLTYLLCQKDDQKHFSVTARNTFDKLYDQIRENLSEYLNNRNKDDLEILVNAYRESLSYNDHLFDYEKTERVKAYRQKLEKTVMPQDITPDDLETVLCSSIPKDKHGNFRPAKSSTLYSHFSGRQFSKQHIADIIQQKAEVTRNDLILLSFLGFFLCLQEGEKSTTRFYRFVTDTNELLQQCNMGVLYEPNPWEAFLMMCSVSECPIATYADVWEMSYRE